MKKFKYLDIGFNNSEIHSFLDDIGDMEAHEIPGYIESLKEKHGTEIDHILASYVVQFGFNEREEVVDALLNSMNNISLTDPTSSNNILHMIITNDHELSEKLINKGINLDHKNKDGFSRNITKAKPRSININITNSNCLIYIWCKPAV